MSRVNTVILSLPEDDTASLNEATSMEDELGNLTLAYKADTRLRNATIHSNTGLNDIEKLMYLQDALKDSSTRFTVSTKNVYVCNRSTIILCPYHGYTTV